MKKVLSLILILGMTVSMSLTAFAADSPNKKYGEFDTFNELHEAYYTAVENDDINRQNELIEIADRTLQEELNDPIPLYDPDEQYYWNLFPEYFSSGYWEERDNGVTLTLNPYDAGVWTSSEKSDGWNSTFARFHNDSEWDNTSIMREQFYCHARLGYSSIETQWNLEPWRTSINSLTCN